jgi:hypothetical protein
MRRARRVSECGGRISPTRRHWGSWGRRRPGRRPSHQCPAYPCVTRIPFGSCGPCGPFGLPIIAVVAAGPLVRSPLVRTKHLDMPADLPSGCEKSAIRRPMLPLWVSFAAQWVSFAAGPGRIAKGGGRAPERAGQDGQGTAGGCPGSEARGTSRPEQARMGPGHRLGIGKARGDRASQERERAWLPGPAGVRQSRPRARRHGPGPGQVAKITISVAGHRHEYRRLSTQPGRGLFADHNPADTVVGRDAGPA